MSHESGAILGTAGHIDHGKTALVRALTGVDTDRLKEEKQRGITIDLGFAELALEGGVRLGVVDVPGHEAFVRTMVAGASGMDVVLLVVAADEGIMPQTREHLAIVELLGVPRLVVALTKADLVDPEWLALVDEEVDELLAPTPYADAARVPTSVTTGQGLGLLRQALSSAGARARQRRRTQDLARLPVDRIFTVQGTGTVVTGTLWSGVLETGARARFFPGGVEARIRGLQVHGRDVMRAAAGDRTAVALTGPGLDRRALERGTVLVTDDAWSEAWMVTVRARLLRDVRSSLEHNQRVRVLLGTAEVMARCALLEGHPLAPGDDGWVQLRMESPVIARAGDRLVLRAYSPMDTIGGGTVVEPAAPKRRRLDPAAHRLLEELRDGMRDPGSGRAVSASAGLAGWAGVAREQLAVLTGESPKEVQAALMTLGAGGGLTAGGAVFAGSVVEQAEDRILQMLAETHEANPLSPAVPLEVLRSALPPWSHGSLADAVIARLAGEGRIKLLEGGARSPAFRPTLSEEQQRACRRILDEYAASGLAPPRVRELPPELAKRQDLRALLHHLEGTGALRAVGDGLFFDAAALDRAGADVRSVLEGRTGLGPTDFREVLPVSRKHLLPLLLYFDGVGITVRRGGARDVPIHD